MIENQNSTTRKEAPTRDMVGVKILIFRTNAQGEYEFLIMHRDVTKYPGARGEWDFPGGRVEANERFRDAARREVEGEVGLELPESCPTKYLARQQIVTPKGKVVTRVTCAVAYDESFGTPRLLPDGEHDEINWVTLEEIMQMPNFDFYLKELASQGKLDNLDS